MTTEDVFLVRRYYKKFTQTVQSGLGDDVEKFAKQIGADKFMLLMEIYIGSCNCPQRQEYLNRIPSVIETIKGWAKEILG